ncbi:hypothetical protein RLOC_00007967 [Lonchura striata]|uniref:Interleukin-4 n=1 Tax=Lonchura striata TaxID=40157 RepID=A0A218V2T7_9PASE|nr:hypothetical protein RLOC_00007967 [Lonchura striata domestica]
MNASMLSYILFSWLLLSVQAEYCGVREIIRYTQRLLDDSSRGHELACFVDGTKHLMENSTSPSPVITRLYLTFQALLDRSLCKRLAHGDQCQYEAKGNVKEFLEKILTTYQEMDKFNA